MTGAELVTAVKERFTDATSARALQWLNLTGAAIWTLESWQFRYAYDAVTVTASSEEVTSEAADLGPIHGFWNSDGDELHYLDPYDFNDLYFGETSTGVPEHWTRVGDSLYVGPISSETDTGYRVYFEKRWSDLADGAVASILPSAYHWIHVPAALAYGGAHNQDPHVALSDQAVAKGLDAMRREYLADVRGRAGARQWGRAAW